jgi:hypothetical protein
MPILDDSDPIEERLTAHFIDRPGVAKKKAFARDALTINGKIFAIYRLGTLVLKLPVETGEPLIESGDATQFEPGPGRFMKEWFVFGPEVDEDRLVQLAEAAFEFVLSLQD